MVMADLQKDTDRLKKDTDRLAAEKAQLERVLADAKGKHESEVAGYAKRLAALEAEVKTQKRELEATRKATQGVSAILARDVSAQIKQTKSATDLLQNLTQVDLKGPSQPQKIKSTSNVEAKDEE